jgi:hypothetical protein
LPSTHGLLFASAEADYSKTHVLTFPDATFPALEIRRLRGEPLILQLGYTKADEIVQMIERMKPRE